MQAMERSGPIGASMGHQEDIWGHLGVGLPAGGTALVPLDILASEHDWFVGQMGVGTPAFHDVNRSTLIGCQVRERRAQKKNVRLATSTGKRQVTGWPRGGALADWLPG